MAEPNNEDDLIVQNEGSELPKERVRANMGKAVNKAAKEVSKKATKNVASAAAKKSLLAAFAPALTIAAAVILVIIITVGIATFINTMPGLAMEKLKAFGKKMANGLASWFGADSTQQVDDQLIFDTLAYLEQVGYDLKGYGFITNYKGAGDVDAGQYLDEDAGVVRDQETDEIKDADSDFIMAYLVSDNYVYTIANKNLTTETGNDFLSWLMSKFRAIQRHIADFFGSSLGAHWTTGLITLWEESGGIGHRGDYYSDTGFLNFDNVAIDANKGELLVKKGIGGSTFRYKLDGWTGRYGMPMEFLLSVHLATLMPDLAYDMAHTFETKVNIILHPVGDAYVPYIENVINHWYRNVYYTNVKYNKNNDRVGGTIDFIEYDYEYEDVMKDRWTLYETDENGEYLLYVLSDEGNGEYATSASDISKYSSSRIESKGDKYIYKGTRDEAVAENVSVTKKAVTVEGTDSKLEDDLEWQSSNGVLTAYKSTNGNVIQKGDALRGETNPEIKKMFLQNTYFSYDGTPEKAEAIKKFRDEYGIGYGSLNSSSLNPDEVDLTTKTVTVQTDSGTSTYKASDVSGKVNLNQDSLNAFSMLENTQTLDADYIYRDFKELIVELGYFEKEEVTDETPRLLAWIIPEIGSYGFPKRELDKVENEFGTMAHSYGDYVAWSNAMYWNSSRPERGEYDEGGAPDDEGQGGGAHTPVIDNIQSVSGRKRTLLARQSPNGSPTSDFIENEMEEIDAIVGQWARMFNYNTSFDVAGGIGYRTNEQYLDWLDNLGGVFSDLAGENTQGEGDGDSFVDAEKYVYGLLCIAGFEYCAGTCDTPPLSPEHPDGDPKGGWERCDPYMQDNIHDACNNPYDAYYGVAGVHHSHVDLGESSIRPFGECAPVHIDEAMMAHNFTTNCNHTTDKVYYKAGLFGNGGDGRPHSSCDYEALVNEFGAKLVVEPKDLHMGDFIECWRNPIPYTNPDPGSWGGEWTHVFFVGNEDEDYIYLYTTGHDFTDPGDFVKRIPRNSPRSAVYGNGENWVGLHIWDLKLSDEKYRGFKGNEAVVSPVTGVLLDYGTYAESDDDRINVDILYDNYITELQAGGIDIKYAIPRQEYKEQVGYAKILTLDAKNYRKLEAAVDNNWRSNSLLENSGNGGTFKFREVLQTKDDYKNWSQKDRTVYGYKEFVEKYEKYGIAGNIIYIDGFKCEYPEKYFKDGDGKYPNGEDINKSDFAVSENSLDVERDRKRTKYKKDSRYYTVSKSNEDRINAEAIIKKKASPCISANGLTFIKEGTILGRTMTDRELIEKERNGALGDYGYLRTVEESVTTDYKVIGNYIRMIMRDKTTDTVVENIEDYMKLDDGKKDEKDKNLRIMDDFDVTDETLFVTADEIRTMFASYSNIVDCADRFVQMQSEYGINAAFAAAVTITESSGGTNWSAIDPSTYNWYSIKNLDGSWKSFGSFEEAIDYFGWLMRDGNYYVKDGNHFVSQIAEHYCPPGDSWSEHTNGHLKDAYSKIVDE